ncbi:MAG TPA: hypothetical protein VH988_32880 [Thermoanaerobaculia bacterium]|jgi:hypothetical protein|nr:hypothetical protein [Thermoanaerobaculia bacterium]
MTPKSAEEDEPKGKVMAKKWLRLSAVAAVLKKMSRVWLYLASVAGVVSIFVNLGKLYAFLGLALARMDESLFEGQIATLSANRPDWLMIKLGQLFIIGITGVVAVAFAWVRFFTRTAREERWRRFLHFLLGAITTVLVSGLMAVLAVGLTVGGPYRHGSMNSVVAVAVVCPQCARMGMCAIRTYANNGESHYLIDARGEVGGPRGHAKVTLQAYQPYDQFGAGWAIFLLRGSDLSGFKEFRFFVRGESGGERIGVKMKDALGVEVPVEVNSQYFVGGAAGITQSWREISIPLTDFPRVDFRLMDNFSIYVDGRIASTRAETIYIGGVEWR